MSGPASRLGPLDGLRAISILLVLSAHLLPLGPKPLQLNATAGAMGMSLFFALSGFLIARTIPFETFASFLVKRLARILPLAYLYALVVAVLFGVGPEALLAQCGFWLNYRPDLMIPQTEHLWSLCVEMHFYAVAALLLLMGRRAIALVVPLCLGITALRWSEGVPISILTHLRVDEILAGACLGMLPMRWRAGRGVYALAIGAAVLWVASAHPDTGPVQYLRPYATGLLLASALTSEGTRLGRVLSGGPLRYIARISYALYVIHPMTAHGWWLTGDLVERYLVKRPLGLLITWALAHLSTFHWERFWIDGARAVASGAPVSAWRRARFDRAPRPADGEGVQP